MTLPKTITGGLLLLSLLLLYFTLRQVPPPPIPAPELPILKIDWELKEAAKGMYHQVKRGEPLDADQVDFLHAMRRRAKDCRPSEAEQAEELLVLVEMILFIHETLTDGGYPRSDSEHEPRTGGD